MKQIVQHFRTGELALKELPVPAARAGWTLMTTRASLISAGTEKMLMDLASASLAGKAMARPDLVRQVVDKVHREGLLPTLEKVWAKLDTPIPLGYSCAGEVLDVGQGVTHLRRGDRIAGAGAGWANHAEYNVVPKNLCVPLPDGVDFEEASFVTLGAIALQGVRQTQPTLGERVVVVGLGLLGLLTVQLLKANGCRVFGFDPVPGRVELARQLGADAAQHKALAEGVAAFTGGIGADAVVITASTKSDEPLNKAAEIARLKARIVVVGLVGMNIRRDLYYRKELDLRLSMSYGPGRYDPNYEERGQDYPLAYVRWTEGRNMAAFLELVQAGQVTPKALISHRFTIHEAERAYELLASKESYLGIVLNYPAERTARPVRRLTINQAPARAPATPALGFIGAGNFARSVLLPRLRRMTGLDLAGVATATGTSARHVAEKFGFGFATTDRREILDDPKVDAVFVVTRHDSHAPLACECLRAGKAVFVEKPLACTADQLDEVVRTAEAAGGRIMVGFNRRFAPLIREARAWLENRNAPLVAIYRVNAGSVPGDSWLVGDEGGGRIVGEVCHFVDTLQFLTGAAPKSVHAMQAAGHPDALSIQITFNDGSIGTIVYSSLGDASFAKEYIEIFCNGRVLVIDDFHHARFVQDGRHRRRKLRRQDKGFDGELDGFLDALRTGGPMPIPLESLVFTTLTTFAIETSLRSARPVDVQPELDVPQDHLAAAGD